MTKLLPFLQKNSASSVDSPGQLSTTFSGEQQQSLLLSPPPIWTRVLIWTLSLGSFSLIAWSTFTKIEETAVLPGQLVTLRSEVKITSPEQGVLSLVNVAQHQNVKKGEVIFELNSDEFIPRLQTLNQKLSLLDNKNRQQTLSYDIKRTQLQSQLALNKELVDRLSSLVLEGSVQEIQLLEKKNELLQAQLQLQNLESEQKQSVTSYLIERNDVETLLSELKERSSHFDIVSPMSGTLQRLGVQVTGQRVQSGEVLATVVPEENLVASVQVSSRLSAPIAPGEKASITVDAFPPNDFGTLEGVVSSISPTTSQPDSTGQSPAYEARISISSSDIPDEFPVQDLRSGMGVSARVVLDEKPIISLVFDFVQDLFKPLSEKR